jgi:hypothetical protein
MVSRAGIAEVELVAQPGIVERLTALIERRYPPKDQPAGD